MSTPRLHWARVRQHYADLAGEPDDFIALGEASAEAGPVKLVAMGPTRVAGGD